MKKLKKVSLAVCSLLTAGTSAKEIIQKPNIVIIYMDDLGVGDISSYGSKMLNTPNIDKLATGGMRFTTGFATSSTSTPSRYALLTGQYPWKNPRANVLPGDAPMLIDITKETLPKMLKKAGYTTGIVGKWHLGLGTGNVNWNGKISPSPKEVGFDYSYIMAATNDRMPSVYVENGRVDHLDPKDPIEVSYKHNFDNQETGASNPEKLKIPPSPTQGHNNTITNGISRIGYMKGGNAAIWEDETMADVFFTKSVNFVTTNKDKPFFLEYNFHEPHVPRVPNPRFVGKSGLGARGDVILEADWYVGQFIEQLEDLGLLENTLIIFSSDNGPVLDDGYQDGAVTMLQKHDPFAGMRGGKYSLYEAGTHVPMVVYWKGTIKPSISDALVCQLDFAASLSHLVGETWTQTNESQQLMDTFLGKSKDGRKSLVVESCGRTAYRTNDGWSMIPPHKGERLIKAVNIETGYSPEYQLYNLNTDFGQQQNLAKKYPDKLRELVLEYEAILHQDSWIINKDQLDKNE